MERPSDALKRHGNWAAKQMQPYSAAPRVVPSTEGGIRLAQRVCDQCRLRKVRCDRIQPCSNCIVAKRVCAFTGAGRKPKPSHEHVGSLSSNNKIEEVESRLSSLESLLKNLCDRLPPAPNMLSQATQAETLRPLSDTGRRQTIILSPTSTPGGPNLCRSGEPILAEQRSFANRFLENALRDSPISDTGSMIHNSVADLRQIIELQNNHSIHDEVKFPLQRPVPHGGLAEMTMPPLQTVVKILSGLKVGPPGFFLSLCSLVGIDDFSSLCRVVYFPSADFSDTTFVTVNIGLYYMFSELSFLAKDDRVRDTYDEYTRMCQQNLETGLANLQLFSITSSASLIALILGTIYAVDKSRPFVAWTLNCAAVQIYQTEGFHHAANITASHINGRGLKSIAIWHIYTMDRALGLRLGRSPILHDWDISIPHDIRADDADGLSDMLIIWFKLATLHGKIYKYLYSTSALTSTSPELIERARALAQECRVLEIEASTSRLNTVTSFEAIQASPLIGTLIRVDEVQLLSTMTLIHRAIPPADGEPGTFSDECIELARKAMRKHHECMEIICGQPFAMMSYAHWNLLLLPFSPFFVLFCHAIETSSTVDLDLLHGFSSSLQHFNDVSNATERLWRLCSLMSSVASMYVEAKACQNTDDQRPESGQFDEYLGQLGFISASDFMGNIADDDTSWNIQAAQINDWFSSSRNMMDLLQHDLSELRR